MSDDYKDIKADLEDQLTTELCSNHYVIQNMWFKRIIKTHMKEHFDVREIEGDIDILALHVKDGSPDIIKAYKCVTVDNEHSRKRAYGQLETICLYLQTEFKNVDIELRYKSPTCDDLYQMRKS